jgi:thioredoxin 1
MNCQPISEVPDGQSPNLPVEVNQTDYAEIAGRFPFLVIDCWAPWCGPCKQITPIVHQLHEQYKGTMTFGFLNTDENQDLAMEFGIMGIPTILVVKDGKHVDSLVGVMPKGEVERRLKELL